MFWLVAMSKTLTISILQVQDPGNGYHGNGQMKQTQQILNRKQFNIQNWYTISGTRPHADDVEI
jgi:hypothetical protein